FGDAREYTIGDMGVGECAGEVVSFAEFGLAESEREVFEAQLHLEAGDAGRAAAMAYQSMVSAARALIRVRNADIGEDRGQEIAQFRGGFGATELFYDRFVGAKFANFLFRAHDSRDSAFDREQAHRHIEEAQLFIEAAHACYDRMQQAPGSASA